MKLVDTKCAICGCLQDHTVIYKQNFNESDFNINIFSARRIPDRIHYQIVRCNKDNLIRSNPVLEDCSVYALYKKSKFTYEEETKNLSASYLSVLRPVLRFLSKEAKVLEIGCGNGFLLKGLHDAGYKNVFGIEPSIDAVKQSDRIIRDKITTDILRADTFKSNTFDLICFFQLFDHIPDPGNFLKICYNFLTPGGFIVALNHDVESLQSRILRERSPIIDIEHFNFFSKETMRAIFSRNNFLPIKIYSPIDTISLRNIIRYSILPIQLKTKLLSLKSGPLHSILKQKIRIILGNICLIATKSPVG